MRCLGACDLSTSIARRALIPAGAIQPWQWSIAAPVLQSSAVDMIQLTGDPQCDGSSIVAIQGEPSDSEVIARIEWAQGPASYWALVDALPGQAIDVLGGTALRVSVGHVGAATVSPYVSVGMQRRGRSTHEATLTTPPFAAVATLIVPPWARYVEIIGDDAAQLAWAGPGGAIVTDDSGRRAPVPAGATQVTVTAGVTVAARWILCL